MTLHIYGRVDGTWLTLSDSCTTDFTAGDRVVKDPDTTKYLTFPLDHTSWKPGEFAAIVMTYDRAEFRNPDGATDDPAISVLRSGLAVTPPAAVTSLSELVDRMWRPVFERWHDCDQCAIARDKANDPANIDNSDTQVPNDLDEYVSNNCGHTGLSVVAVAINSADGHQCCIREWGEEPSYIALPDRIFQSSGDGAAPCLIDAESNLVEHLDEVLSHLDRHFDRLAQEAEDLDQSGGIGGNGPIGGTRYAWTLSPTEGFRELPERAIRPTSDSDTV
ncbi:hypothetical protein MX572_26000 (plasmid) [Rhodococcus pyridinivorans]|uniref:hypothetical protein n=1 Tax=Rhodococcus pyridinivorans TaxID=103816 RepID=UPI0020C600BF|nr:hypothetical protein [Rhodococcus pyridinivorans]UTM40103.1 hypothetical protein MX572_26000 [Rhodococcus pyridinivorans]